MFLGFDNIFRNLYCSYRIMWYIVSLLLTRIYYSSYLVCPEMTTNGVLALSQSRHPIIEKISSRPFVPNNIFASQFENFHIVTGPNMSGIELATFVVAALTIND